MGAHRTLISLSVPDVLIPLYSEELRVGSCSGGCLPDTIVGSQDPGEVVGLELECPPWGA